MMQFFRKYQRFFFIVLTAVIIISFSFFGTYSSMAKNEVNDPIIFTKVDNKPITASEMNAWVRFIASDAEDKMLSGGAWGPNFLNDGVVKKDFLESGLSLMVANPFLNELKGDLDPKLEKEKKYTTYVHPGAAFLSADSVWAHFAPKIKEKLEVIKNAEPSLNEKLLDAQIALYLEEKKFPEQYLRQVILYQEGQYQWIKPDVSLQGRDLSLFGHASLEDWFGPQFLELTAKVVMNTAALAEKKGYKVSESDALQDLYYNNEISFRQLQQAKSLHLGVTNSSEYFKEQLRILGMDQKTAVDIWRQVLLFRQLANGVKNAVVIDPVLIDQFHNYAGKSVDVEIFQMKEPLRFNKEKDLQKFDTYLNLIALREKPLEVPTKFKSIEEIKKTAPELVQTAYNVKLSSVTKQELQTQVPLKGAWEWELQENNWLQLIMKVPELGKSLAKTRDERLNALDALDSNLRFKVDSMARSAIVDAHPEWAEQALAGKPMQEMVFNIKEKGTQLPIDGVTNAKAFQALLEAGEPLKAWSEDGLNFYNIELVKKNNEATVLTFEEAQKDKTLDQLLDKRLEKAYGLDPKEAKTLVAEKNFTPLYDIIIAKANENGYLWHQDSGISKGDFASAYFFLNHVSNQKEGAYEGALEPGSSTMIAAFEPERAKPEFTIQFDLEKVPLNISRKGNERFTDVEVFLNVNEGDLSKVLVSTKEGPYFFKVIKAKQDAEGRDALMQKAQEVLGLSASKEIMKDLLEEMIQKKALTLSKAPSSDV